MQSGNSVKIVACSAILLLALAVNASAAPPPTNVNVVNTPNVQVGNTTANPVQVRDVDNPARQPWQMGAQVLFAFPNAQEVATFAPAIPEGKVFVIEFMTARTSLPTGQRVYLILFTDNGFSLAQHFFAPTFIGSEFGADTLVMSQLTRLYTIFGPTITVTRFADNAGSGFALFSLSGYLLDR